jgi:DNA/RNA endonuclease YhcR with UshA esterase domain
VATVSLYGDTPQLVPASTADIVSLSQAVTLAIDKQIVELTTSDVGQLAVVRGGVTQVAFFSSGVKLTLDDGTGEVIVLLWQSLYDELLDLAALDVGAEVQVRGEVSQYRGELELIPELSEDVQLLAAAPPPAEVTIGALTTADVGRVVLLHGTLGPPDPFSAGIKFLFDDGTGQLTLLLWSNVAESAPVGMEAGAQVEVTGEIAEYRGELELIPRNGGEIVVTGVGGAIPTPASAPVPTPTVEVLEVEAQPIGDVTAADTGRTLALEGTLGPMETFSAGIKFPLDDGTGTIILLLWQNVYDAIPDADRLVAGATVKVMGEIEEYRGDLEIIPEADGVLIVE